MGLPPAVEKKVHRQAAAAIGKLLEADAKKRGGVSIKTLTLAPQNVAKKATYALTCETLRYLPILKQILEATPQLRFSQHLRPELAYVLVYDLLFGQGLSKCAPPEQVVLACKSALRASLARLLVSSGVSSAQDLLPADSKGMGVQQPRYARVNTLKTTLEVALQSFGGPKSPEQDPLIPNLLVFPPGTDLHDHALVKDGRLILQGKASCMPAQVLSPDPSWTVIDACAAPGNKTVHLAALMQNKGKIIACDADAQRVKTLRATVRKADARNIDVRHQDFLKLDPDAPEHAKVRAILLDPSCSGSGTRLQRMDHLLPSGKGDVSTTTDSAHQPSTSEESARVNKLAAFQEAALRHALNFPNLQKLVYSTCSVYRRENEDVIAAVLPDAKEKGFQLARAFPEWLHRGLAATFPQAHCLVRTDAVRDHTDGFFVALFEKGPLKDRSSLHGLQASTSVSSKHPEIGQNNPIKVENEMGAKRKLQDTSAPKQKKKRKTAVKRVEEVEGLQSDSTWERESGADGRLEEVQVPRSEEEGMLNGEGSYDARSDNDLQSKHARQSLLRRRKAKRARKKERSRESVEPRC